MLLFAPPSFCHLRFLCLCIILLVFSVVYLVACDDPIDFGGVSIAQDALRNEAAEQGAEQRPRVRIVDKGGGAEGRPPARGCSNSQPP